jgi:hypothetical protein
MEVVAAATGLLAAEAMQVLGVVTDSHVNVEFCVETAAGVGEAVGPDLCLSAAEVAVVHGAAAGVQVAETAAAPKTVIVCGPCNLDQVKSCLELPRALGPMTVNAGK